MNRLTLTALFVSLVLSGCGGGGGGNKVVEGVEDPEAYEREVKAARESERNN